MSFSVQTNHNKINASGTVLFKHTCLLVVYTSVDDLETRSPLDKKKLLLTPKHLTLSTSICLPSFHFTSRKCTSFHFTSFHLTSPLFISLYITALLLTPHNFAYLHLCSLTITSLHFTSVPFHSNLPPISSAQGRLILSFSSSP